MKHDQDTELRIISAATKLFAKNGYEGTSVKDICTAAKANIAAIHYHFDSKEKLYSHIIEQFVSTRLESSRKTLQAPKNLEELKIRLEIFLSETVEAMINQPELILIIQREMEMAERRSEEVFRKTMLKHFETLVLFFTQAKQGGFLASEVDPFLAAGMFFSQFAHQTRIDGWAKRYFGNTLTDEKFRGRWIKHTLRVFLNGIS